MKEIIRNGKYIVLGLFLVLIDQLTKYFFSIYQRDFGFFAINYTQNTGVAFGFFQGANSWIIVISFIAIALLYWYRKEFNDLTLTLLFSGIIGNLIDRIFRGFVVDFIDFKIWPIFNFADIYLVLGVAIVMIISYQNSSKSSKASK